MPNKELEFEEERNGVFTAIALGLNITITEIEVLKDNWDWHHQAHYNTTNTAFELNIVGSEFTHNEIFSSYQDAERYAQRYYEAELNEYLQEVA